jgi:hypothetical protein
MIRLKASVLHLAISIAVVGGVVLALLSLWYPLALWPIAGIDRSMGLLLCAVTLVGPLLTWLVYRPDKPKLRLDMAVIVLIQMIGLAYAVAMLGRIRPVFMVAAVDRLQIVLANDIDRADLAEARLPASDLSWTGPTLVGLNMPSGTAALLLIGSTGNDYPMQPVFYAPYTASAGGLLQRAGPIDALLDHASGRDRARIEHAIAQLGRPASSIRFLPLASRLGSATMLVDARDATPLLPVAVDPWIQR